jgi:ribosomal protein L3 glutamine methyltransferase
MHRVLDLCTGSACIAIAIAKRIPGVTVDAADISEEALSVAAANVERHGVGDRVRLVRSDLFGSLGGRRYDLIVSNPPYVSARELAQLPPEYGWEPELGLLAVADGLECALRIMRAAPSHLEEGGVLFCEVGEAADRLQLVPPGVELLWQLLQAAAPLDAALTGR